MRCGEPVSPGTLAYARGAVRIIAYCCRMCVAIRCSTYRSSDARQPRTFVRAGAFAAVATCFDRGSASLRHRRRGPARRAARPGGRGEAWRPHVYLPAQTVT